MGTDDTGYIATVASDLPSVLTATALLTRSVMNPDLAANRQLEVIVIVIVSERWTPLPPRGGWAV